jgi:hypothetical protein
VNKKDIQALDAISYTVRQDAVVREDIRRAITNHDRAFFAQVVYRVINRLRLTVSDSRRFIDTAYEWFRNSL